MELCTGGSLYEVIDSPENAFGLSESEFKQVIYDVGKRMLILVSFVTRGFQNLRIAFKTPNQEHPCNAYGVVEILHYAVTLINTCTVEPLLIMN